MNPSSSFNWRLFFKRTWAAYAIGTLWTAESIMKHDRTGLALAIATGFVLAPAIGYIWTASSTKAQ